MAHPLHHCIIKSGTCSWMHGCIADGPLFAKVSARGHVQMRRQHGCSNHCCPPLALLRSSSCSDLLVVMWNNCCPECSQKEGFAGGLFGCSAASSMAANTTKKLAMLLAPSVSRGINGPGATGKAGAPAGWVGGWATKERLSTLIEHAHHGSNTRMAALN
jgi:hypothetical protein